MDFLELAAKRYSVRKFKEEKVRQEDLDLLRENDFTQQFAVEQDSSIRLGGFILLDKYAGMMIDQSFDSKLDELFSYFIQTSGLMINQEQ